MNQGFVVLQSNVKLDEISLSAPTTVCELADGNYRTYEVTPEQLGLERCRKSDLTGGTPAENAAITRAILDGSEKGHKRGAVLLNAGAALWTGGKAESLAAGVSLAGRLIDSGRALEILEAVRATSRKE